jgi:hypothetical protein
VVAARTRSWAVPPWRHLPVAGRRHTRFGFGQATGPGVADLDVPLLGGSFKLLTSRGDGTANSRSDMGWCLRRSRIQDRMSRQPYGKCEEPDKNSVWRVLQ